MKPTLNQIVLRATLVATLLAGVAVVLLDVLVWRP